MLHIMEDHGNSVELNRQECRALDHDRMANIFPRDYETMEDLYYLALQRLQTASRRKYVVLQRLLKDLAPICRVLSLGYEGTSNLANEESTINRRIANNHCPSRQDYHATNQSWEVILHRRRGDHHE